MSGGHFDYQQYIIGTIADAIEDVIGANGTEDIDECGYDMNHNYSADVIIELKRGVRVLRQAQVFAQRADWLFSGDDGEKSFINRLSEELGQLEQGGVE